MKIGLSELFCFVFLLTVSRSLFAGVSAKFMKISSNAGRAIELIHGLPATKAISEKLTEFALVHLDSTQGSAGCRVGAALKSITEPRLIARNEAERPSRNTATECCDAREHGGLAFVCGGTSLVTDC